MSETNHTPTESFKGWIICLIASLFFFFQFLQLNLLNVLGYFFTNQFHLTPVELGWLSSTYLFALTAFFIPAGLLLDRYPIKNILLIFILLSSSSLLLLTSQSLEVVIIARMVSGFAHAVAFLGALNLIHQWLRHQNAFAIGVMMAIGLTGGVVANLPFQTLVHHIGWQHALYWLAGCGFILGLGIFVIIPSVRNLKEFSPPTHPLLESIKYFFKGRFFLMSSLYICFMNAPLMILGALWGNQYFHNTTLLTSHQIAVSLALFFAGTLIGSPLLGWLAHRISSYYGIIISCALLASIVTLGFLFIEPLTFSHVAILLLILGFFTSAQSLGYPLLMDHTDPAFISVTMGINSIIIMAGGACLQPLFGWLLQFPAVVFHSSYKQAFIFIPLLLLLSVLIGIKLKHCPLEKR